MNTAVIIASLAIVALAILVPSGAVPTGVAVAEKHAKSSESSTENESSNAQHSTSVDLGDHILVNNVKTTTDSKDYDAKDSSFDEKYVDTPNGKMSVKSSKTSSKSYDYDSSVTRGQSVLMDDPSEC